MEFVGFSRQRRRMSGTGRGGFGIHCTWSPFYKRSSSPQLSSNRRGTGPLFNHWSLKLEEKFLEIYLLVLQCAAKTTLWETTFDVERACLPNLHHQKWVSKLDMGWVMIRKKEATLSALMKRTYTSTTITTTWVVQKEWYFARFNVPCFSIPDEDKGWNRKKKEEERQKKTNERKMISYSYPHPNRPPPLPPSYKESEEGLTIQVVDTSISFCDIESRSSFSQCVTKVCIGSRWTNTSNESNHVPLTSGTYHHIAISGLPLNVWLVTSHFNLTYFSLLFPLALYCDFLFSFGFPLFHPATGASSSMGWSSGVWGWSSGGQIQLSICCH